MHPDIIFTAMDHGIIFTDTHPDIIFIDMHPGTIFTDIHPDIIFWSIMIFFDIGQALIVAAAFLISNLQIHLMNTSAMSFIFLCFFFQLLLKYQFYFIGK